MRTSANVEALLEVEDRAPKALFATLPGTNLPIWSVLRQPLAQAAANVELGTSAVQRSITMTRFLARLTKNLMPGRYSSTRVSRNKDFLVVATGATLQQSPSGWRNWLTDPFAEEFKDRSVVLQDRPIDGRSSSSRPTFSSTFSYADAIARVDLLTKLAPLSSSSQDFARDVVREIIHEFPFELDTSTIADLERRTLYKLGRVRYENSQFGKLLDRVHPKIVYMEDASYGGRANLIQLLKARNILVAELQHGWIGPYHTAYNFGAAMSSPALLSTLPDVVLTFGDFWSDIIRHPSRLVAIGKPHLESTSALARRPGAKANDVLIISSVYQRDELMDFTLDLRRQLPVDWSIRLRPHPSERQSVASLYPRLVGRDGIKFDESPDVATSLTTAKGVFGFSSTVLYEALAFNCQVAVLDSPLADFSSDVATFGERVSDAASLSRAVERLHQQIDPLSHSQLDDIWKPNSIENFREFVTSIFPENG